MTPPPPPILDDRKSLSIKYLAISDQCAIFCSQNGNMQQFFIFFKWPPTAILEVRFGPFWMTENHFRSFQINMQLLFSQNGNKQLLFCIFFIIWLSVAILDDWKSLLIAFLAISDQYATLIFYFFFKMAAGGHFGSPICAILDDRKSLSIAFLAISDQCTTHFVSQNGCRRPFWMTENHFRSHFSLFQINTQLLFFLIFFHKMAAGGHFGWPKITFDRISRHFRSIRNFFFSQNGCRRPFWMTDNHFWSHFSPFQINTQIFIFFFKMAASGHFGSSIWAILDDQKSLSIAFLAISDKYTTFFWFFFSKWPPAAILEVQFVPKTIGFFHYVLSMAMPNMKLIGEFMTQRCHKLLEHFYTKWPPEVILFFRLMPKIIRFL